MSVSLPPDLERWVNERIAAGEYASPSEVVREAIGVLESRDRSRAERLAALRADIQIGLDQLARGQSAPLDIDEVLAEARRRRAARA